MVEKGKIGNKLVFIYDKNPAFFMYFTKLPLGLGVNKPNLKFYLLIDSILLMGNKGLLRRICEEKGLIIGLKGVKMEKINIYTIF